MFFDENECMSVAGSIPADESYDCETGPYTAMIEAFQDDFDFFKEMCFADVKEMQMITNEAATGEIQAFREVSIKGIKDKIVNFINRIIAKIKGIFNSLIRKIESFLGGKAKKYYKENEGLFSSITSDVLKEMDGNKDRCIIRSDFKYPDYAGFDIEAKFNSDEEGSKLTEHFLSILIGTATTPKDLDDKFAEKFCTKLGEKYTETDVKNAVSVLDNYDGLLKTCRDSMKGIETKLESARKAISAMDSDKDSKAISSATKAVSAANKALSMVNSKFIWAIRKSVYFSWRTAHKYVSAYKKVHGKSAEEKDEDEE